MEARTPIDTQAVQLNESATLLFDFSDNPVRYFSLIEIDTLSGNYLLTLTDGSTVNYKSDTTSANGDSGEFLAFYSNDSRRITSVSVAPEIGDNFWGFDNLAYGNIQVLYVDQQAGGTANGLSWTNAFPNLQDALFAATPPTSILVAEGVYRPHLSSSALVSSPELSFSLAPGLSLFGGYPSGGAPFSSRDGESNPTLLSGSQQSSTRSYHVLSLIEPTSSGSVTLEELFITGGSATGPFPDNSGAGIALRTTFPTRIVLNIRNCIFFRNVASGSAGGISSNGPNDLFLDHCKFSENTAGNQSSSVGSAAALRISGGELQAHHCLFEKNNAASNGGAVLLNQSRGSFTNCVFAGNTAESNGGAIFATNLSQISLFNCTLQGNRTGTSESLAANQATIRLTSNSSLTGSGNLIWDNLANGQSNLPDTSLSVFDSSFGLTYSLAANLTPSELGSSTNLDGSDPANGPRFLNARSPSLAPTVAGDLRLTEGSPAIDVGDPLSELTGLDFRGEDRLLDGTNVGNATIDIGAHEYRFGTFRGNPTILAYGYLGQALGNSPEFEMTVQGTSGQTFSLRADYLIDNDLFFPISIGSTRTFTGLPQTFTFTTPPSFDRALFRLLLVEE